MKAALFHAAHQPLSLEDIPRPEPGPGEIVMEVVACGVCHSDLHYTDHGVKTFKTPPLVLGHEASGHVAAVGPGVRSPKEGDAILLPATYSCGACFYCRTGRENICANMKMYGNDVDGSFAEYVLAPAKDTVLVPKEIPLENASIIADAISTPYFAVKQRAGVRPGDTVAVVGCGGMGINAVQAAAASGARVIAVDLNP
ncbi:MAG: alcohol dehydrogenase catalytic domain-containing protein, partial [Acidobacteria bacterium]|nr:alcohol dehydrogenase catalytic domain-containing protein [Acidobacteriota bacterium]